MVVPAIMQWLIGTWFIIASDAPIWLKGDKHAPTLNYTLKEHAGSYKLLDETKYHKNNRQHTIAGYDHLAPNNALGFIWRGKGFLFFVTSKWQVRLQDKEGQWAVIAYSKTLFTPEGVDIMCRKPVLDGATLKEINRMMREDTVLAKHADKLKQVGGK